MGFCHTVVMHCPDNDLDYDGPDRCAECGGQADRPFTCIGCAHKRAVELAEGDLSKVANILDELLVAAEAA